MLLLYISHKNTFFIESVFVKDYVQEIQKVEYFRKKYVTY